MAVVSSFLLDKITSQQCIKAHRHQRRRVFDMWLLAVSGFFVNRYESTFVLSCMIISVFCEVTLWLHLHHQTICNHHFKEK